MTNAKSIEEILDILDGGDTVTDRASLDPDSQATARRVERIRSELAALPEMQAPRGNWDRIVAQYRSDPAQRHRDWLGGFAVAAGAAVVAVLVLTVGGPNGSTEQGATPQLATTAAISNGASPATTTAMRPASMDELRARSQQLERRLASLPSRPRVVRAATVDTITQLEDRISLVDYQLSRGGARSLTQRDARALWQQRVELMNTLWRVRSAEAQRSAF